MSWASSTITTLKNGNTFFIRSGMKIMSSNEIRLSFSEKPIASIAHFTMRSVLPSPSKMPNCSATSTTSCLRSKNGFTFFIFEARSRTSGKNASRSGTFAGTESSTIR